MASRFLLLAFCSLVLVVGGHIGATYSLPIQPLVTTSAGQSSLPQSTTTTATPQIIATSTHSFNAGDFLDDADFDQLLLRLRSEADSSIRLNAANYVPDDADVDTIYEAFRAMEQTTVRAESTQSSATISPDQLTTTATPRITSTSATDEETATVDECPICLQDMTSDLFVAKCNHRFHYKCLLRWTSQVSVVSELSVESGDEVLRE